MRLCRLLMNFMKCGFGNLVLIISFKIRIIGVS